MIYVIGERRTGVVKIGSADDPYARLRRFQAGNPRPLQVLVILPGDRYTEIALHRRFVDRCTGGEWFDFRDEDAVIAVVQATAEPELHERRPAVRHAAPARPLPLPRSSVPVKTLHDVLRVFEQANAPRLSTAYLLVALAEHDSRWSDLSPRAGAMALARELTASGVQRGHGKLWIDGQLVQGYERSVVHAAAPPGEPDGAAAP